MNPPDDSVHTLRLRAGWPRAWWLLPIVDIVEGITFFGAYFGETIFWAGRRYTLRRDGTLAPAASESQSFGLRVGPLAESLARGAGANFSAMERAHKRNADQIDAECNHE